MRLRPVRLEDAAFIVWLRNQEHVKGRVGDSATSVASQEAWLKKYFTREGDYYFILETPGGTPLGTHGLYDVQGTSAEKGRQIMRPEVMGAGVPAALLATDLAFEKLGMTELRSNCVSTNLAVHSLHRKSGFKQVGVLHAAQTIDGKPVDLFSSCSRRKTGIKSANASCRWPIWPANKCWIGKNRNRPGASRGWNLEPNHWLNRSSRSNNLLLVTAVVNFFGTR